MILFRYDKTFEGLLTAVFDAYARRIFPDVLLAENDPGPLFVTEEHAVDGMLLRYMRRVFDSGERVQTDFADPDILRVKQLAQKVSQEREKLMQFTRFQKGGDNSWFAPVSPRYNALPLAIPYFSDRFRDQRWLIYDIKRRYGFYYDLETVTEVTMEDDGHLLDGQLDEALMADDEKLFQSLWKTYFHSMAIKERINPKLQRQHMPRRFWKLLTELQ